MSISFHKMLSKTLVGFLIVSCISDCSHAQKFFRKDYAYLESTEAFYKVHTQEKTWLEAKKQCADEGAFLFYPEDEREAQALISFWTSSHSFEWVYVGISDLVAKGVFVTVDGVPISDVYQNWAPGEPNDAGGNEDCIMMKKVSHYNDIACDKKLPFICKKTLKSLQWNPNCNLPNLDYRFNETFGGCYKLHTTPLSWVNAFATCAAEQSYLTVINSPAEAEFIVRLAQGTPADKAAGLYLPGAIHSGFHNRLNDGWQTVKGTTLEESGYMCWNTKLPGAGNEERCGSIFFNGRLDYINCDSKSVFVCEHDVDMSFFARTLLAETV